MKHEELCVNSDVTVLTANFKFKFVLLICYCKLKAFMNFPIFPLPIVA